MQYLIALRNVVRYMWYVLYMHLTPSKTFVSPNCMCGKKGGAGGERVTYHVFWMFACCDYWKMRVSSPFFCLSLSFSIYQYCSLTFCVAYVSEKQPLNIDDNQSYKGKNNMNPVDFTLFFLPHFWASFTLSIYVSPIRYAPVRSTVLAMIPPAETAK